MSQDLAGQALLARAGTMDKESFPVTAPVRFAPFPALARKAARTLLASALIAGLAGPLSAQTRPDPEAEARRQLNEEQAQFAAKQVAENTQKEQLHAEQMVQQERNATAYETVMKQYNELVERYEADRAQWETDNAACAAGDKDACPRVK